MEVRRLPNWDGTAESTELYHHGIKGQKWGVRRYQNPDGSLTAAGRKRYYSDEYGIHLTKAGEEVASNYSKKAGQTSGTYAKKIASENSDLYNQYKEMKKEDYRIAEEERQKWLSQKDYKGMDYYQFKDARAIKFENSEKGKAQRKVEKQLAEKTEQYVKTIMKKIYDTPLNEVERRYSTSAKTYGQDIRNRTLNQLLYPGSAELSKKTTPPRGNKKGKTKVTLADGSVFTMTNPSWKEVERLRKLNVVKSIE